MDFGNTQYYNQKKRVITLRKGRGRQTGYATMNGSRIVSRRPTVYYIMNNGAIRALTSANTNRIPSALKYKVLKGKAPKKVKNPGNGAALSAALKPKRKYTRKSGAPVNQARANAIRAKRLASLAKARAAKKMHSKNLPGFFNNNGNLFGPTKANRPKHDPRNNKKPNNNGGNQKPKSNNNQAFVNSLFNNMTPAPKKPNNNGGNKKPNNNWNLPNPYLTNNGGNAKNNAANNAANNTANKLEKVAGVTNATANAAAAAAGAAAASVTPAGASSASANNIANAAANGAAAAVQALPVAERNNKNAVSAAAAAGASQAASAAKNGKVTPTEAKNMGAAAGTAVKNTKNKKPNNNIGNSHPLNP